MTSAGEVFLLQCSKCGAKMTQSGSTVGGNDSCSHKYGPLQKKNIVYPTDAERNWLRIIDQNKDENIIHTKKFENDISELNKLKSIAMQEITTKIKTLQSKLETRQDQLEQELTLAFQDRRNKINENVKILNEHKIKNEEAKEKSEDLLADGDKKEAEREKIIVSECETIINTTPNLQYIETELRFTFGQLDTISRKIAKFGILITQPIDSGMKCIFKSTSDATNAPSAAPKKFELPTIQLKSSTFDNNKQKVKLSFKVNKVNQKNENKDIDIYKYLLIYVECSQDIDNEDEKGDEMKPIHQQTVPFKDCELQGKKYTLYVNKKFSAGITVAFKLKPKFNSPNKEKFSDCEGKWSREQTYGIPEDEEEEEKVMFNCVFNNKKDTLILNDDDNALTNYKQFLKKFKNKFNIKLNNDQIFQLTVNNKILSDKSVLITYASDSYLIKGNIKQSQIAKPASPGPVYNSEPVPNIVSPLQNNNDNNNKKKNNENVNRNEPKQISTIVVYKDTKKRVVLKNNPKKNTYEYKMKTLKSKLSKKFSAKGLQGDFTLQTDDGTIIENDMHIVEYLADYKGEIKVTQ